MSLPLLGAGPGGTGAASGPPTVAPNLYLIEVSPGSYMPTLNWTASNRSDTPGFRYEIWYDFNGGGYNYLNETTSLSYSQSFSPNDGTYTFEIRPKNTAGEGPSSNAASVNLPGEL